MSLLAALRSQGQAAPLARAVVGALAGRSDLLPAGLRGAAAAPAARGLATEAEWEAQREAWGTIKVDVDGPLATIKLSRPEALNALNSKVRAGGAAAPPATTHLLHPPAPPARLGC